AFSQGLVVVDGQMYEGTGQYGQSTLRKVELTSGRVEQMIPLSREYFGEGITVLDDKLYQLTWKERLGIVYELATLKPLGSFRYSGEGWGLANDGRELILSDGSATLRFLNPKTFEVTKRLEVRSGRSRVDKLNELEFVNDEIWANIWYSDKIARISPKTGEVLGWIDASGLYPASQRRSREHVMNGIAYDASTQRVFLTGKMWPRLFEVEVLPAR
ncbi:MAG: glutamine cyclotransferase, partial [Planctomycetales bacterium 12-60-4]